MSAAAGSSGLNALAAAAEVAATADPRITLAAVQTKGFKAAKSYLDTYIGVDLSPCSPYLASAISKVIAADYSDLTEPQRSVAQVAGQTALYEAVQRHMDAGDRITNAMVAALAVLVLPPIVAEAKRIAGGRRRFKRRSTRKHKRHPLRHKTHHRRR